MFASPLLAAVLALACQEDPNFDGEWFTSKKDGLKFRVPKDKNFTVVHDREQLKELGETMICVGTNDSQNIILFLVKETAGEEMDDTKWIEKWDKSWEEKLGGKENFRKDGGSKRKSGLPGGEYTIKMDGQDRRAQVTFLNRAKDHYMLMVIGRSGGDWLQDRDDVYAISDSLENTKGGVDRPAKGGAPSWDGECFTSTGDNLTFRVPKGKGFGALCDPAELKKKGMEKYLCVGGQEPDLHIVFYLLKETTENDVDEKRFVEVWEESWKGILEKYAKDGSSPRTSGLTCYEYTIRPKGDATDRKAIVVFQSRGKEHFIFMVLGRTGGDWFKDRDDARAVADSFKPIKK